MSNKGEEVGKVPKKCHLLFELAYRKCAEHVRAFGHRTKTQLIGSKDIRISHLLFFLKLLCWHKLIPLNSGK